MTRNVLRYCERLIGPVVTTALVILAAAAPAWGQPSEVIKLLASDAAAEDNFGFSCAISADTAIIGAKLDDHGGNTNAGSAYIYQQDEGSLDNWGEVAILRAGDPFELDQFGYSVSIGGDVAIVGAPFDDDTFDNSGSAYLFSRDWNGPDQWGQIAKLTASDPATGDNFGWSVSISGDFAIVGAPNAATGTGAAYIFIPAVGQSGQWEQVAKLTASDGATLDNFGWSVSISGDTVIIGAPGDAFSGSAYIFNRPPGGWQNTNQEDAKLTAPTVFLGWSVSISADTAIAGAIGDNNFSGAAFIHLRTQRRRPGAVGASGQAHRLRRCVV